MPPDDISSDETPAAPELRPSAELGELEGRILAAQTDLCTPRVNRTGNSQNNEEEIILRYFSQHPPKNGMRLMDIGAWDGVALSNSRALVERGWHSVLVEAAAGPATRLMKNCRGFNRTRVVQALVVGGADNPRLVTFQHTDDAISTTSPEVHAAWKHTVKDYFPIIVPTVPVEELLKLFGGPFDFITIDTEGETFSIFSDIINLTEISLLVVEHSVAGISTLSEMRSLAFARGFKEIAANGENVIFGMEELE